MEKEEAVSTGTKLKEPIFAGLLTCDEVEICNTKIGTVGARYRWAIQLLSDCITMCKNRQEELERLNLIATESLDVKVIAELEIEVGIVIKSFNQTNAASYEQTK